MKYRSSVIAACLVFTAVGGALAVGLGGAATDNCRTVQGRAYHATIRNARVSSALVAAKRCDTLTITNEDTAAREVAFGIHDHHVPYDGVSERVLNKGQSLTVTLDQTGTFRWHDHLHDEVEGRFTVRN
jgi:plastocyanin